MKVKFTMGALLPALTAGLVFQTAVFAGPAFDRRTDSSTAEAAPGVESAVADPFSPSPQGESGGPEADPAPKSEKEKQRGIPYQNGTDPAPESEEDRLDFLLGQSSFGKEILATREEAHRVRQAVDEIRTKAAEAVTVAFFYRILVDEAKARTTKTIQNIKRKAGRSSAEAKRGQELINEAVGEVFSAESDARKAENGQDRALIAESALEAEARSLEARVAELEVRAAEEKSEEISANQMTKLRERAVLFKVAAIKAESDLRTLCQSSFGLEPLSVKDVIGDFKDL